MKERLLNLLFARLRNPAQLWDGAITSRLDAGTTLFQWFIMSQLYWYCHSRLSFNTPHFLRQVQYWGMIYKQQQHFLDKT